MALSTSLQLTACYVQGADLLVEGEEGKVHRTGTGEGDPADKTVSLYQQVQVFELVSPPLH